jgi:membrane-associated phospholipid phosphatase
MTTKPRLVLGGVGVLALAGFVTIALLVLVGATPILRLDISWHQGLRMFGIDHPAWLSTMRVITHFGDTVTILVVDVALFVVCLRRGWVRGAVFVATVGLGGWALRVLARDVVGRPRPDDPLWSAEDGSFPSGHTTNATLMVILGVVVGWSLVRPGRRYLLVAGGVVYALAVGFSRVAGAVHWPTDVVGGYLFATSVACLVAAVFPWAGDRPANRALSHGLGGKAVREHEATRHELQDAQRRDRLGGQQPDEHQ